MSGWADRYFKLRPLIVAGQIPEWLQKHPRRERIIQEAFSSMPWPGNRAAVRRFRLEAAKRGLVSDHIVPVQHPYVCGLTVPWNLQTLTHKLNQAKGNKWHPDQLDAWETEPEPHQLQLAV